MTTASQHNCGIYSLLAAKKKNEPKCRRKSDAACSDMSRLDLLLLSVGLARLDLLAGLLDLLQDGIVVERVGGDNLGGLGLEGDVVGLNA
jgi:hypothetical protein